MIISSVLLENIKRFNSKPAIFGFAGLPGMYTLSGGNGSGKTAIFRSVQVFQKIFFLEQMNEEEDKEYVELHQKISMDLDGLMSSNRSVIDIAFKDCGRGFRVVLHLERNHLDWSWGFQPGSEDDMDFLRKYWNIENPTGIVAFIDASKSFSEFGVGFDDIKLLPRRERQRRFMLDCVFDPERTLQSIYRKAVIDHVQYRIDPKRGYPYFKNANNAIKNISQNIEVTNVSATKLDGQLVIVGRTSKGAPLFDIKDFSSGERALYLTLLFLYYLPNIGVLIIDEPENHLHESLLCRFYDFLEDFLKAAKSPSAEKEPSAEGDDTEDESGNGGSLEQIFLTTHSKALIYRNMDQGFCYAMDGESVVQITATEIERDLRANGISTVYSRTLFVEGTTEVSLMAEFLERDRIKVTPVMSCKEVISYFEKISSIRTTVHGAAFCFAIDSDNRTKQDIDQIRAIDPDFYDQSFSVLNRHEVENLFIEESLILDVVNEIRAVVDLPKLEGKQIKLIMEEEAGSLLEVSRNKYIASGLRMSLKQRIIDPIIDVKKMKSSPIGGMIESVINPSNQEYFLVEAKNLEGAFDKLWAKNWMDYVDGKAYMGKLCQRLSRECAGMNSSNIREKIINRIKKDPDSYAFGKFYKDIINKFEKQGAL